MYCFIIFYNYGIVWLLVKKFAIEIKKFLLDRQMQIYDYKC